MHRGPGRSGGGERLKAGLGYRQFVGGLFLAGIRNIKPRPVGFKFHAVMVISSAHQLSLDAAQESVTAVCPTPLAERPVGVT